MKRSCIGGIFFAAAMSLSPHSARGAADEEGIRETALIGMGFLPFLWLLIVAVVVSLLMYFLLNVKLGGGIPCHVLAGWLGAWLGSPVFGYWFEGLSADGVYFIPAVLGSAGMVYGCYAMQQILACPKVTADKPEQPE